MLIIVMVMALCIDSYGFYGVMVLFLFLFLIHCLFSCVANHKVEDSKHLSMWVGHGLVRSHVMKSPEL